MNILHPSNWPWLKENKVDAPQDDEIPEIVNDEPEPYDPLSQITNPITLGLYKDF